MQHESKFFVYLQRLSQKRVAHLASVMQSVSGIFYACDDCNIPAESTPRALLVMGNAVTRNDLDSGLEGLRCFRALMSKLLRIMKNARKTAWRDTQSITFKADWLDFTEHLSNAQVGRLLRCVARFERGDINPQHVAELRKDAAVGVAYNFITEQLERRAR